MLYLFSLRDSIAPNPLQEIVVSSLFTSFHNGLLFKSHYLRHIRRLSNVHDQLVVPHKLISSQRTTDAMITPHLVVIVWDSQPHSIRLVPVVPVSGDSTLSSDVQVNAAATIKRV